MRRARTGRLGLLRNEHLLLSQSAHTLASFTSHTSDNLQSTPNRNWNIESIALPTVSQVNASSPPFVSFRGTASDSTDTFAGSPL